MDKEELFLFIKTVLLKNGDLSVKEAARLANVNYDNFNRKLKNGTLRTLETVDLLNALGYTVYAEKDGKKIELK